MRVLKTDTRERSKESYEEHLYYTIRTTKGKINDKNDLKKMADVMCCHPRIVHEER